MSQRLHDIYHRFPAGFPLPMILDGATGTALMKRGMPKGACTEEWVLTHPDAILEIQESYLRAGADAVYSPTFGANCAVLARHGIDEDVTDLNRRLIALSKSAAERAGGRRFVGGDMSPTGCMMEPYGDTPFEEVAAIYAGQARALAEGGADFIVIETNISLQETRAAVLGTRSVTDLPIFATLTFDAAGRTLSGDTLPAAVVTLANLGVCAVGANCSGGPADMLELLVPAAGYAAAFGIPLIAKPNAGLPRTGPDGNISFDLAPEEFGAYAERFLSAGVFVLGGCCGTDDRHIARLRAAADRFVPPDEPAYVKGGQAIAAEFLAASNQAVCDIRQATKNAVPIPTDDSFLDAVTAAQDTAEVLHILVTETGAEVFLENEFFIRCPVVLSGEGSQIRRIRRRYNGHAIVI